MENDYENEEQILKALRKDAYELSYEKGFKKGVSDGLKAEVNLGIRLGVFFSSFKDRFFSKTISTETDSEVYRLKEENEALREKIKFQNDKYKSLKIKYRDRLTQQLDENSHLKVLLKNQTSSNIKAITSKEQEMSVNSDEDDALQVLSNMLDKSND